jgi:hypothetical protein
MQDQIEESRSGWIGHVKKEWMSIKYHKKKLLEVNKSGRRPRGR